jgi:hypothetical protein
MSPTKPRTGNTIILRHPVYLQFFPFTLCCTKYSRTLCMFDTDHFNDTCLAITEYCAFIISIVHLLFLQSIYYSSYTFIIFTAHLLFSLRIYYFYCAFIIFIEHLYFHCAFIIFTAHLLFFPYIFHFYCAKRNIIDQK